MRFVLLAPIVAALVSCGPRSPDVAREPTQPPPADIPRPPQGTSYYRVKELDPGFDANAKLEVGDIILRLNGEAIYSRYAGLPKDWLPTVVDRLGDRPVIITVLRGQQEREFQVQTKVDAESLDEDGSPRYRLGVVVERVDYLPMHAPRGFSR